MLTITQTEGLRVRRHKRTLFIFDGPCCSHPALKLQLRKSGCGKRFFLIILGSTGPFCPEFGLSGVSSDPQQRHSLDLSVCFSTSNKSHRNIPAGNPCIDPRSAPLCIHQPPLHPSPHIRQVEASPCGPLSVTKSTFHGRLDRGEVQLLTSHLMS